MSNYQELSQEEMLNDNLLKEKIKIWLVCDDKIREANKLLKNFKDEKKTAEKVIITMLQELENNTELNTQFGTIRKQVRTVKKPLKEKVIENALLEYTHNPIKAKEMTTFLLNKRQTLEKVNLKRIGIKK